MFDHHWRAEKAEDEALPRESQAVCEMLGSRSPRPAPVAHGFAIAKHRCSLRLLTEAKLLASFPSNKKGR